MLSRHPRLADGVALTSGLALPLAFAPFHFAPLAVVCMAGLFATWMQAPRWRAAWRGWLFGLGSFGAGVSWIVESFQVSHVALPIAVALTAGMVALLALYPALLGLLVRGFARRTPKVQLLVALPAAWTLLEWLRGWLFTGFTWLQLGYSQIDWPLQGLLPLLGVYGASWAVALTGAGVVLALTRAGHWAWLALPLGVWLAAAGAGRVEWTEPAGDPLTVAMVQGNIAQPDKWRPEMRGPTLERYMTLTRQHWNADLVVWPETALPGIYQTFEAFVQRLDAEATASGSRVLFGVPWVEETGRRVFNSLVLRGLDSGVYHKRHLVPFGEFLPLRGVLEPLTKVLGVPSPDFTRGSRRQPMLIVAGHPVSVSICYEVAFGAELIRSLPAARFLITVSNDAWFGESIGPHQHFQIARARALETGRYLARSTNTGISGFIGPDGAVISRSPQFEVHVLAEELMPMSGATPYVRWADWPVVIAACIAVLLSLVPSPRVRGEG